MVYFFSQFFIFAEEVVGLRFEVVELVAKFPYLIFGVFLCDGLVQLFDYLLGFCTHLLDFSLHQRKHLVLVIFQAARDVFIYGVDDAVYSSKMGGDCLLRFSESGPIGSSVCLDESEESGGKGRLDEAIEGGIAFFAANGWEILLDDGVSYLTHAINYYCNFAQDCSIIITPLPPGKAQTNHGESGLIYSGFVFSARN